MGLFRRPRQRRELADIGAALLHEEFDSILARGAARKAAWQAELADVEADLAAIQAEFDGFPGNGLVSPEIAHLEEMREQLHERRWRLRGKIWLLVKPDEAPNTPPDDWDAGTA